MRAVASEVQPPSGGRRDNQSMQRATASLGDDKTRLKICRYPTNPQLQIPRIHVLAKRDNVCAMDQCVLLPSRLTGK